VDPGRDRRDLRPAHHRDDGLPHRTPAPPPLATYPSGSWGPAEADTLLESEGRSWRKF